MQSRTTAFRPMRQSPAASSSEIRFVPRRSALRLEVQAHHHVGVLHVAEAKGMAAELDEAHLLPESARRRVPSPHTEPDVLGSLLASFIERPREQQSADSPSLKVIEDVEALDLDSGLLLWLGLGGS